jgi:tight adherence protein B
LIQQTALNIKPHQVMLVSAGLALVSFLLMATILKFLPMWILALIAAISGVAGPIIYLKGKSAERVRKFQEQFPDALDLVVRSLRVGHPLSTALSTIAKEIPDPLGREFAIAARQVTFGKSTPEAINGISRRINLPDIRFFAVAVQIHHESGGNLAEILNGLSTVIRERFQLFRKMRALTVEGRFSAWFLSLFPIVMIFVMGAMQPGYYEKVRDFAFFPHAVVVTFFLLVVNIIAMRMITKLEV